MMKKLILYLHTLHIHTHIQMYVCSMYTHTYIHMYTHTYIYMYITHLDIIIAYTHT